MAGTLTITGLQHVNADVARILGPFVITGSATLGQVTEVVLINGTNTIPIPAGSTAVLIEFPLDASLANTPALIDSGGGSSYIPVGPTGFCVLSIDPTAPQNIIMTGGVLPSSSPTRFTFI